MPTNEPFLFVPRHPIVPVSLVGTRRHHENFKNLTRNTPQPKKNSGPLAKEKWLIDPAITLVGTRPERQKKHLKKLDNYHCHPRYIFFRILGEKQKPNLYKYQITQSLRDSSVRCAMSSDGEASKVSAVEHFSNVLIRSAILTGSGNQSVIRWTTNCRKYQRCARFVRVACT